jgi:transposase-like protein
MAEKVKARKGTPPPKQARYNEEFKRNAVHMYLRSGKTQEVLATELGVSPLCQ